MPRILLVFRFMNVGPAKRESECTRSAEFCDGTNYMARRVSVQMCNDVQPLDGAWLARHTTWYATQRRMWIRDEEWVTLAWPWARSRFHLSKGAVMAEHRNISSSQSLMIAAVGFAVWAIGYVAIALPFDTGPWEWAICVLGPLIIAAAVITHGSAFRVRFGRPAFVLFVIALVGGALVFLPHALSIQTPSNGWAAVPTELWGTGWIVGGIGVVMVIAHKQSLHAINTRPVASYAQLSLLSSGMLVYGIGYIELGNDRLSHEFGAVAFGGASLIAISLIAMRRSLAAQMGAPAASIAIFIALAWALDNFTRVVGDLMTLSLIHISEPTRPY